MSHEPFPKIDYILGHKTHVNPTHWKEWKSQSVVECNNGVELEINDRLRTGRASNIWILKDPLDNAWSKQKFKRSLTFLN